MNVLLIIQAINLAAQEIVPIEQLVERIKSYFTLDPNAQVNIQNLSSSALQADNDTLKMIADWQMAHNLPVTVKFEEPRSADQAAGPVPGPAGSTTPQA